MSIRAHPWLNFRLNPDPCSTSTCAVLPVEIRPGRSAVRRVDPVEQPGWDALVASHPNAGFFHGAAWAKVLRESYGYNPTYFILTADDRLRALLPVMEVNSWLTGRRGVSLPFTDLCEPLDHESALKERVLPAVIQHGRQRGWKYLECRGGKNLFNEALGSESYFTHELRLSKDVQRLLGRFDSATRRSISKAERLEVTVEIGQTLDAMRIFYSLHCSTRRKHGLPPPPFRFFENVHRHIVARNLGIVVLASHRQTPIAAGVYFHSGTQAIFKYGASDEGFQDMRGNNLVMWEAIKWYARNGFDKLNLGRTSIANAGLRRFKLGWGCEERIVEYLKYDLKRACLVSARDDAFGWYNRVFNALPVWMSRMIGTVLYRHVA